jgi:predicted lipoprotein with Yx(FWY)xxD motif
MTLYTYKSDSPNVSTCNTGCSSNWPPLTAPTSLMADPALTGTLTTFARADGTMQVSYKGAPLYFHVGDNQPGDTSGAGLGGVWSVATP